MSLRSAVNCALAIAGLILVNEPSLASSTTYSNVLYFAAENIYRGRGIYTYNTDSENLVRSSDLPPYGNYGYRNTSEGILIFNYTSMQNLFIDKLGRKHKISKTLPGSVEARDFLR